VPAGCSRSANRIRVRSAGLSHRRNIRSACQPFGGGRNR
jgi:hypothetical protein